MDLIYLLRMGFIYALNLNILGQNSYTCIRVYKFSQKSYVNCLANMSITSKIYQAYIGLIYLTGSYFIFILKLVLK